MYFLFKFRCNIFIGVKTIKEMPGSVACGTPVCLNVHQYNTLTTLFDENNQRLCSGVHKGWWDNTNLIF